MKTRKWICLVVIGAFFLNPYSAFSSGSKSLLGDWQSFYKDYKGDLKKAGYKKDTLGKLLKTRHQSLQKWLKLKQIRGEKFHSAALIQKDAVAASKAFLADVRRAVQNESNASKKKMLQELAAKMEQTIRLKLEPGEYESKKLSKWIKRRKECPKDFKKLLKKDKALKLWKKYDSVWKQSHKAAMAIIGARTKLEISEIEIKKESKAMLKQAKEWKNQRLKGALKSHLNDLLSEMAKKPDY